MAGLSTLGSVNGAAIGAHLDQSGDFPKEQRLELEQRYKKFLQGAGEKVPVYGSSCPWPFQMCCWATYHLWSR